MSYSSRYRYKSMREKNAQSWKRFKAIAIFGMIILAVLAIKNRVLIKDYFATFIY